MGCSRLGRPGALDGITPNLHYSNGSRGHHTTNKQTIKIGPPGCFKKVHLKKNKNKKP
jgi:hypothetical protein